MRTGHERDLRAVLLDLDDTLIVEEAHAMAQVRATAALAGVEPYEWETLVIETARSQWYASEHHPACRDLGIASWEGLWATFEGAHPLLAPLQAFVGTYRSATWSRALELAGKDPELARQLSTMYIERQRAGHPLASGSLRPGSAGDIGRAGGDRDERATGHPAAQAGADRSGRKFSSGGHLRRAGNGQTGPRHLPARSARTRCRAGGCRDGG